LDRFGDDRAGPGKGHNHLDRLLDHGRGPVQGGGGG